MQIANFLLFIYNNCSRIKIGVSRFWFFVSNIMLDRNCETTIIILMISNLHFIIHWPVYIHDITIFFYRIFWIIKYFFYTKARSTTSLPNSLPPSPATNHLWSAKHQPWLSVYMYIKTIGVYSRILQYVWRSKKSMYKRTKTSLIWLRP